MTLRICVFASTIVFLIASLSFAAAPDQKVIETVRTYESKAAAYRTGV